jgi:2-polyprenyl-3-methyl-5-hydroxy-6-metoxy-1,4-benzoquinol methylase
VIERAPTKANTGVLSSPELAEYWRALHAFGSTGDDVNRLEVVCYAGAPPWLNERVAKMQERAFRKGLAACGELPGARVLEVGCGAGRWSRLLRDLGSEVHAVDLSQEAVELNQRRIPGVAFEQADLLELDFDRKYDLAVSVTVLQHLPSQDQQEAVRRLHRALRPGGRLLLLENTRDRAPHVFSRSIRGWRHLLEDIGFAVPYSDGVQYLLPLRAAEYVRERLRHGDPRETTPAFLAEHALRDRTRPRRLLRALLLGPLVLVSTLVEGVAHALPADWATHAAIVAQKRGTP